MQRTDYEQKVIYTFNNFYLNFLTDIKKYSADFKHCLKKHVRVFDRSSPSYFDTFYNSVKDATDDKNAVLVPTLTLGDALDKISGQDAHTIWVYYYIFRILAVAYDDDTQSILDKCLEIVRAMQTGASKEDVESMLSEVLDDDLHELFAKLGEHSKEIEGDGGSASPGDCGVPALDETLKVFENSKIGNLAKEISSELDFSSLNIDKPEDVLNLANLSGSNNVLGNIVSKVSDKIQSKISSGELSQAELVGEAASLLGMLNNTLGDAGGLLNNPLFGDALKHMMGAGGSGAGGRGSRVQVNTERARSMDTRARLRQKLEKREKERAGKK
jgi:hypothetical protein